MSDPVIVPRDTTLDQLLSSGQVLMLIIGSSSRASELAAIAGQISDDSRPSETARRCAVQVMRDDAVAGPLREEVGDTPDPTIVTLKRDGTVVRAVVDDGEIERIDLEDMFVEAAV